MIKAKYSANYKIKSYLCSQIHKTLTTMKNFLSVIGAAIVSLFAPSCSKTQKVVEEPQPATEPKVAFSVSDTSTVVFSKGNLQYNVIEHKWRFAPTQYDVCHENNDYVGDNYSKWTGHGGWTDLFGVGTWLEGGNPVNTSVENDEYNLRIEIDKEYAHFILSKIDKQVENIYKNKMREFYFDLDELPGPIVEKE